MLFRSKEFKGRMVAGVDGEVGKVADILFDDQRWTVRYLVVETGTWLDSRKVLISPVSLASEQPTGPTVKTTLTREQIEASPPVETDLPVSRQYEIDHAAYYGYPNYWTGGGLWGPSELPYGPDLVVPEVDPGTRENLAQQREHWDSHLHSCEEVAGYHIQALDGEIGHLDEFLIDPRSWQILRLVIDTRNWLPGKYVKVDPERISQVDWAARKVHVDLTRDQIKALPEGAG